MSETPSKYALMGKIPPQFIEAEERLLSTYLQSPPSRCDFLNRLTPEMFYKTSNGIIYRCMTSLQSQGQPVDMVTLSAMLKKQNQFDEVGGMAGIVSIIRNEVGPDRVESYINIVRGAWMLREIIGITSEATSRAYDISTDPVELMASLQESLLSITGRGPEQTVKLQMVIDQVFNLVEANLKSENRLTGVPTGFTKLDRHTGGWQPGDLIVVAGETSNGKTAFAINTAVNAAEFGHPVGIFSLEMTNLQNGARMIATRAGVSSKSILMSKLPDTDLTKLTNSAGGMIELPIWFDDTSSYQIDRLMEAIRAMVIRHGVKLVIVDYLQLIKGNNRSTKTEQVAEIANDLKRLANSLRVPILLLSQLRRDDQPKPTLGRLKGSGDIENAADLVVFVMRPEIYNLTQFNIGGVTYETPGLLYVDVAKGRNYGLTEFGLSFNPELGLISDLEKFDPVSNDYGFEIQNQLTF